MTKKNEYVVTAKVAGYRKEVSIPMSKEKATASKSSLEKDMKMAIPKYHWASNIRLRKKVYHRNIIPKRKK